MTTKWELFRRNKLQTTRSKIDDVYVNHELTWLPTNQGQILQTGKNAFLRAVVIGNGLFVLSNSKDNPKQCRWGINMHRNLMVKKKSKLVPSSNYVFSTYVFLLVMLSSNRHSKQFIGILCTSLKAHTYPSSAPVPLFIRADDDSIAVQMVY